MDQEPERVTSPSPSPKIRRGDRKSLCANVFVHSNRRIILALRLAVRNTPHPVALVGSLIGVRCFSNVPKAVSATDVS